MSSISTQITLIDAMTAPLNNAISSGERMISTLQEIDTALQSGFDAGVIDTANQAFERVDQRVDEIAADIGQAERQQLRLNDEVQNGKSSMDGFANSVMSIVAAYAGAKGLEKLANLSDSMTLTTARLNMMNDGLQTTQELQDMIFASAQRSRAAYQSTANMVAKLGTQAKDAFSDNGELIAFTEALNKSFAIAGADGQAVDSVMYNMTQALASGVLRGQDLNAVFSNAPNIIQNVADYLDVPIGKIRDMAAEGQLSASVIKNAMLAASGDINAQFESMPITWAQVWTGVTNQLLYASQPLLEFISMLAQNWSILEPIVIGAATALGAYIIVLGIYNGLKMAAAIAESVHAAAAMMATGKTLAQTAAQHGLNAALLACPLTWILLIIIAVIAAVYAIVAAINKVTGETLSATGIIAGSIAVLAAIIWNTVIGVINAIIQFIWTFFVEPWIGIIEWILNVFNGGFDSFGDAVKNLLGQIISWFLSLGKVVTQIIDAIFGTNWTAGLSSLQDSVLGWGKNENAITLDRNAPMIDARLDYGEAWDAGYSFGEGVDEKVGAMFGGGVDDAYEGTDPTEYLGDIEENTSDIADSVAITGEDLKYLRDLADRETVNRFTTAEIRVEMNNNNNIHSGMDIDGVVNDLTAGVNEAMEKAAEGVHE